jgi:hypothetical protein
MYIGNKDTMFSSLLDVRNRSFLILEFANVEGFYFEILYWVGICERIAGKESSKSNTQDGYQGLILDEKLTNIAADHHG